MYKFCCVIALALAFSNGGFCQQSAADKKLLDSLIKADDFLSMLDLLDKGSSYVKLNLSIGNKLFSVSNNSINAMEQNRKIVLIPSMEYFNKSGLGVSFAGFFLNNGDKAAFYQYSLTPSYDYRSGNKVEAGISFTRFFIKDKYGSATSPIQNDLYLYANVKKKWLKPGLSLGYSTGEYNQIDLIDTTVKIQNRLVRIKFTDTVSTKIKSLSLIGSVSHIFLWDNILHSNDALFFIPQFSLNMGSNRYAVTHKSSTTTYRAYRKRVRTRIRNFEEETEAPKFKAESIGLNFDVSYNTGKFNFEPQLYLDFYLPSTTEKRFTQIFSFNVGYTF